MADHEPDFELPGCGELVCLHPDRTRHTQIAPQNAWEVNGAECLGFDAKTLERDLNETAKIDDRTLEEGNYVLMEVEYVVNVFVVDVQYIQRHATHRMIPEDVNASTSSVHVSPLKASIS